MTKRMKTGKKAGKKDFTEDLREIDEMKQQHKKNAQNFKINCKFKNNKQKEMFNTIMNNRITFVHGVAGTGKTMIALMAGLECIKNSEININQIVLTKPIVEITSQRGLGALPGDLSEKTSNYFSHFYDNLSKLVGNASTTFLKESGVLKETVLNFLRGSTFGTYDTNGNPIGSFCIFDESQNSTVTEMLTFISRMGQSTKLVVLGDSDQTDLKLSYGEKNGLEDAIQRLSGIEQIGFCEFTEDDIVRDPFLVEIMKRYKNR